MNKQLLVWTAVCAIFCTAVLPADAAPSVSSKSSSVNRAGNDSITGHYLEKVTGDTLDVKVLPGGKIKIDLNAFYPCANPTLEERPGGPNMGETAETIAIKNGVAVYSTKEFGGQCKIVFTFSAGKVDIDQEEHEIGCCGYGMNVNASGTYRKVSSRPRF